VCLVVGGPGVVHGQYDASLSTWYAIAKQVSTFSHGRSASCICQCLAYVTLGRIKRVVSTGYGSIPGTRSSRTAQAACQVSPVAVLPEYCAKALVQVRLATSNLVSISIRAGKGLSDGFLRKTGSFVPRSGKHKTTLASMVS
jgi:hypothetical protein